MSEVSLVVEPLEEEAHLRSMWLLGMVIHAFLGRTSSTTSLAVTGTPHPVLSSNSTQRGR